LYEHCVCINYGSPQLYLPAGWWHYVRQGDTPGRPTIAINWWYDVEMRGMSWVWLSFLRKRLGKMSIMEDEN
jgi:jumonji domain-containing protein 7